MLKRSTISKLLTTRRIKRISCPGMLSDQQYIYTARPQDTTDKSSEVREPPVWRDRLCATIQLHSIREARSLHCL